MSERERLLAIGGAIGFLSILLRAVDLPTRGRWDDDQGAHLLAVRDWVVNGVVPLVGPTSSLGEAHHGALYYWLLAPSAALTGTDPVWATATLLAVGIAAVLAMAWLGRVLGGVPGAIVMGLLAACSPAWIEASTFLWNPNLVPAGAAIATAGAWTAWARADGRWWLVATAGLVVAVEGHLLAMIAVPPFLALLLVHARRAATPVERRRLRVGLAASLVLLVAAALPLVAHELRTGFSETRAIGAFLAGGRAGPGGPLLETFVVAFLRSLSWPLTGLLTGAPVAAILGAAGVVVAAAWRWLAGSRLERAFVAWSALTTAWSVVALAVVAPGLATIVPELPTDHYHAFLDPLVLACAGLGIVGLWRLPRLDRRVRAGIATAVLALALAAGVPAWPPSVAPDGGWPAAEAAAARVSDVAGPEAAVVSLPEFKTGDGLRFPLVRRGVLVRDGAPATAVTCDPVFEEAIGAACGGPAEDAWLARRPDGSTLELVDRFTSGSRRVISVYVRQGS